MLGEYFFGFFFIEIDVFNRGLAFELNCHHRLTAAKARTAGGSQDNVLRVLLLNEREHRQACDTAAGVLAYRPGAALLASSDTYTELGLQWTDLRSGLQCKGRADIVHKPEGTRDAWVVDLKTVQSCDPQKMARDAARMGYHGQLEHYAAGVEAVTGRTVTRVGLLCVEGAAPHDCALLWLDDEAREAGRALRDRLLQTVADGEHRNVWPGQVPEPVSISLPQWAVDEAHDFDDDFTGGE